MGDPDKYDPANPLHGTRDNHQNLEAPAPGAQSPREARSERHLQSQDRVSLEMQRNLQKNNRNSTEYGVIEKMKT